MNLPGGITGSSIWCGEKAAGENEDERSKQMTTVFSVLLKSLGLGLLAVGGHCREFSRKGRSDLLFRSDCIIARWQMDWSGQGGPERSAPHQARLRRNRMNQMHRGCH